MGRKGEDSSSPLCVFPSRGPQKKIIIDAWYAGYSWIAFIDDIMEENAQRKYRRSSCTVVGGECVRRRSCRLSEKKCDDASCSFNQICCVANYRSCWGKTTIKLLATKLSLIQLSSSSEKGRWGVPLFDLDGCVVKQGMVFRIYNFA